MKGCLCFFFFFLSQVSNATNYYFSSKGHDADPGTSALKPWQSVDKLKSVRLRGGDSVLFHCGEIFTGGITAEQSGEPGRPIVYSSYGRGAKPVLSGFMSPANWRAISPGIFEADLPGVGWVVNMVTMDGVLQVMGRYPNRNASNKGYLSYESSDGNNSITDKEWTSRINWTGAELVIRKNRYILDRCPITGQSNGTFFFTSPTGITPTAGYGFFIQDDPRTLDQPGEWYFNRSKRSFQIFLGSRKPESVVIRISKTDILLRIQSQHDISVNNLQFEGANIHALEIINGSNVQVTNCAILFSGVYAVNANTMRNLRIENCTVDNTHSNALYIAPYCSNTVIRNNRISNTGMNPGMGKSDHQQLIGLVIEGEGQRNMVENNEIISTGYCGIVAQGDSFFIQRNLIKDFCQTIDDGGGIYSSGDYNRKGRVIKNNIILNGKGVHEGTSQAEDLAANGIYMDDRSANVSIMHNTVANCSENGIFLHNAHEIDVIGNMVYNNRIQYTIAHDRMEPGDPVTNLNVVNNIFIAPAGKQSIMRAFNVTNDLSKFGVIDQNIQVTAEPASARVQVNYRNAGNDLQTETHEFEAWKSRSRYDQRTKRVSLPVRPGASPHRFEYNAGSTVRTIPLRGKYTDASGKRYSGSVRLEPYTSIYLMRTN